MGSNVYIAASGALSRLRQLEVVANNLANADTAGFKADRAVFRSAFESAAGEGAAGETGGPGAGVYVRVDEVGWNDARGGLISTGAALDAAIDGPGFFVLETAEGEAYTRAGSFVIGPEGDLMTPDGRKVLGDGGPIRVSRAGARIRANGDIVDERGGVLGSLRVVEFESPAALSKLGAGAFRAPEGVTPDDVDAPSLHEGSLEASNVQRVVELANLMVIQRAFDASIKAMQSDDGATERLIKEMSR